MKKKVILIDCPPLPSTLSLEGDYDPTSWTLVTGPSLPEACPWGAVVCLSPSQVWWTFAFGEYLMVFYEKFLSHSDCSTHLTSQTALFGLSCQGNLYINNKQISKRVTSLDGIQVSVFVCILAANLVFYFSLLY